MAESKPVKQKKSEAMRELSLRFEKAKTEKAEIQVKKAQGELIEIEKVRNMLFAIAATTKEKFEAIPQNVARKIAAIKDPREIEVLLRKEITTAMFELSREGQRGFMLAGIEEKELSEEKESRSVTATGEDAPEDDEGEAQEDEQEAEPEPKARPVKGKKPKRERYDPYGDDE